MTAGLHDHNFVGCIADITLNGVKLDMMANAIDGRNVKPCEQWIKRRKWLRNRKYRNELSVLFKTLNLLALVSFNSHKNQHKVALLPRTAHSLDIAFVGAMVIAIVENIAEHLSSVQCSASWSDVSSSSLL
ncbi:unnamed protein product [Toxocara canis]|uniref:LAM_G_DOMAIN domain-containing protein n=1 Tax=Toxocara canis TaxID=6265 RepID=A0A183U1E6_TOXCA|nr:unnamed protein product [Toxocara canis]